MPKEPVEILAIRSALGNVVYTVPAYELIDKGWLAKLELRILRLTEDFHDKWEEYKSMDPDPEINTYEKFKDTYFPDYTSEKEYLQRNEVRNNFLIDFITDLRQREKGNTLVLVNNVNFGKKLAANIDNAYFIYGKDDTKVRAEIYKLFSTNDDVVVIATFKLVSTGLNIPRIFNMVLVDSGKSFIQVIQSIGRSLRKAADKDTARVYDVCSDLKYSKKHTRERIRYYKEQKYPFKLDNIDYNQIYV
jgi:superfamily II DNA or RNA helicase